MAARLVWEHFPKESDLDEFWSTNVADFDVHVGQIDKGWFDFDVVDSAGKALRESGPAYRSRNDAAQAALLWIQAHYEKQAAEVKSLLDKNLYRTLESVKK